MRCRATIRRLVISTPSDPSATAAGDAAHGPPRRTSIPTEVEETADGRRLTPFLSYGIQRGLVEGLLAARGIALAAVLGAEWFGAWSLARIGQQYSALGGIGLIRGLEVEVSASDTGVRDKAGREVISFGRATLAWYAMAFGTMTAFAAVAAWFVPDPRLRVVLGGLAIGLLIERVWLYAASFMRARGLLSRLGWYELINGSLHLALTVVLALAYGIWGAFVGFLLAHLIGAALTSPYVPLLPQWSTRRIATLARIGFPVSVSQFLHTLMISVDRLVVGIFLGVEVLGFYAFAVAVSGFGAVIGSVFRTVLFPGVFRMARRAGPDASIDYLELALFSFTWLFAPVFGLAALAIAPAVEFLLPGFAAAVPPARIFMFIGIVQGLNLIVQLGVVAHDQQYRLPLVTGGAFLANLLFAVCGIALGFTLEALAGAALVTRLAHVLTLILLVRRAMTWRSRLSVAVRVLAPIVVCVGLVIVVGRMFQTSEASGLGTAIAVYVSGLAVLAPGIVGSLKAVSRLNRETR